MNLFRDLIIAAAAFCSFNSIAGVINFNWTPNQSSYFNSYKTENGDNGPWLYEVLTPQMAPVALTATFNIEKLLGDSGVYTENMVTQRESTFFSSNSFDEPRNRIADLCSYTTLTATECSTSSINQTFFSTSFDMTRYSNGDYSFIVKIYGYFELERSSVYNGNFESVKTRTYDLQLNLNVYTHENVPIWLQNLSNPSYNEALDILKSARYTGYYLRENLSVSDGYCLHESNQPSCNYTKAQLYRRHLFGEGSFQAQTETVTLPATTSFLLLGLAGLALRRRLTA